MNETTTPSSGSHGGMLIPFDMFRLSQLAGILGELLIGKARNILDARLVAVRHEASRVLLLRIEGHVVGDEAADFWRGNPDLALVTSQAVPHRVLMYWAKPGPAGERREGYLFAQRGQVIASDEASDESPRPDGAWPVSRLCEQMRLDITELADGFPGSPRVEISLVDASGYNDEQLLMTLVGRDPAAEGEGEVADDGAAPAAAAPTGERPQPAAAPGKPMAPGPAPRANVEEDAKRRATEAAAEALELRQRAEALQSSLEYVTDDLGIVSLPAAGLSEADLLRPLVVASIHGDLPSGLPRTLTDSLQGHRSDIAIPVEFLSEVFVENKPLSRPEFQARATTIDVGGRSLQALDVLAPRLGYGTLLSTGKRHAFISRKLEVTLPAEVMLRILDGQG